MSIDSLCCMSERIGASARIRNTRLLVALALTYVGLVLDAKMHSHASGEGLTVGFTMLLGWLPSIMYVGLLEYIWRSIHRNKIDAIENLNTSRLSNSLAVMGRYAPPVCFILWED